MIVVLTFRDCLKLDRKRIRDVSDSQTECDQWRKEFVNKSESVSNIN